MRSGRFQYYASYATVEERVILSHYRGSVISRLIRGATKISFAREDRRDVEDLLILGLFKLPSVRVATILAVHLIFAIAKV